MGLTEIEESIKRLADEITKDKVKEKKMRIPFTKRTGKSQKRKNYVSIFKIQENGEATWIKKQIIDQTIMEDDIPRLASAGYILRYKKYPLIILPSWSVKPFCPREEQEASLSDGSNSVGYRILLARMKSEAVNPKKQIGNVLKWVIGLGLGAIIIYALLTGGGV